MGAAATNQKRGITVAGRLTVAAVAAGLTCAAPFRETFATGTQDQTGLEEVVVTGSLIHGSEAAGSKLIVITREQIDASGYERIEDLLATIPQNLNRANPAAVDGSDAYNFYDRGSEVQLRGLGVGSTLVLVNGQRQGLGGYQGSTTDVSSIPGSAIERIEILPEGSSALYGSDAIGGVVNIILRKNFDGVEMRVREASAGGDANERTVAGLWGHSSARGNVLLGLQYDGSRALACSARSRCASGGDLRGFGGSDWRVVGGNPGTILDYSTGVPIAAIPRGQDGTKLTATDLIPGVVNFSDGGLDADILPSQLMRSAFLGATYKLTNHWDLSVNGRYSEREFDATYPQGALYPQGPEIFTVPPRNSYNHLGGQVVEAYDFTSDIGPVTASGRTETSFVAGGLKGSMPGGWQLRLSAAYSKSLTDYIEYNLLNTDAVAAALDNSNPTTALNIFGDGTHTNPATLAALRAQGLRYQARNIFATTMANVIADGPLGMGPAGPIRLAVGSEFRRAQSKGLNIADLPENRSRKVWAAFFEFEVPLQGASPGAATDRLDLSFDGRYDHYNDAGNTFNPKLGLSWRPTRALSLRGNWGTSFRAPPFIWSNPDQVGDANVADVVDSKSPTGYSRALLLYGPVPNMKPEQATNWSVGADLLRPQAPNLSVSLTYFSVDYSGKIRPPDVGSDPTRNLIELAQTPALITRNPTQAQLNAVCQGVKRFVPPSIGDCSDPITVILDVRFRNLARVKTSGLDLTLDHAVDTPRGRWESGLRGTYIFDFDQQLTSASPTYDYSNSVGNALKLRLAAHLSWSHGHWTVLTTVNHTAAYLDPDLVPARNVDSWTTVDMNLGYRIEGGQGWMDNAQCNLGVNNLFNEPPPFVDRYDLYSGNLGYDAANASLLGRQLSLQFTKRWGQ